MTDLHHRRHLTQFYPHSLIMFKTVNLHLMNFFEIELYLSLNTIIHLIEKFKYHWVRKTYKAVNTSMYLSN